LQTCNFISACVRRNRGGLALAVIRRVARFLFYLSVFPAISFAQNEPAFEEIPVFIDVKSLGTTEIPALLHGRETYLSLNGLFDFLQVSYQITPDSGFFKVYLDNPKDPYLIDRAQHRVVFQKNLFPVDGQAIRVSGSQWFLRSDYLGALFGLECTYDPHSLSAVIKPKWELQVVRIRRLQETHTGTNHGNNTFFADATIGKQYRLFHFNSADWAIQAIQQVKGPDFVRMSTSVGGVIAGGEFRGFFTHASNQPFSEKQQYYLWRYANNKNPAVRQVLLGKISTQPVSTLFNPVVGVQVTNAPTYVRKAYGSYTYTGYVQPNWVVELYVNNVFVDYLRSDAMGLIRYNIPLSYGNTEVTTRYIGPWGEEHRYTQAFIVPFTLLPANVLEYRASAGMVEDSTGSFFTQARVNYGCTDRITLGAGVEYLTSVSKSKSLPFVNAAVRLASNLTLSGEYVNGVRYKGLLTYGAPSGLQAELQYVKYDALQEAVRFNYSEERRLSVSMPFHIRKSTVFSRLALNQNMHGRNIYTNVEWMVSWMGRKANLSVNSYAYCRDRSTPAIYSNISSSLRMPKGFTLTPKATWDYTDNRLRAFNLGVSKYCSRKFTVNASYERRFDFRQTYWRAGMKYDFSFARFYSNVNVHETETSFFQSAGGSLLYDKHLGRPEFSRISSTGKGGLLFSAFLDINGNGKKELFEPLINSLNVKINGSAGRKTITKRGVLFTCMEPYLFCEASLDGNSFENLSWKILQPHLRISVDPNQVKRIYVPVVPLGEVSGTVYRYDQTERLGLGGISVAIYDHKSVLVAKVATEEDGFYSYLGLKPGKYTARIEDAELDRAGMERGAAPAIFMIKSSKEGDLAGHQDFLLQPRK